MDYSQPGSSVHAIFQARTGGGCHFLLQGTFPTQGSNPHLLLGVEIPYHWATWEAPVSRLLIFKLLTIWIQNLHIQLCCWKKNTSSLFISASFFLYEIQLAFIKGRKKEVDKTDWILSAKTQRMAMKEMKIAVYFWKTFYFVNNPKARLHNFTLIFRINVSILIGNKTLPKILTDTNFIIPFFGILHCLFPYLLVL